VQTNEVQRSWILLPCFLRAFEVVRASPPELVRGDIGTELAHVLEDRPTIVFQTAVFGYLAEETVQAVRETLSEPGRPLAFVSAGGGRTDQPAWGMRIFRPGREREFVGHADFHGAWLDYAL
jgi:hypothetical protein